MCGKGRINEGKWGRKREGSGLCLGENGMRKKERREWVVSGGKWNEKIRERKEKGNGRRESGVSAMGVGVGKRGMSG